MIPSAAVRARAMQKATAQAKDEIKRAGHKWSAYSVAEKKELAQNVLVARPQLITEARADVEQWTLAGYLGLSPVLLEVTSREPRAIYVSNDAARRSFRKGPA